MGENGGQEGDIYGRWDISCFAVCVIRRPTDSLGEKIPEEVNTGKVYKTSLVNIYCPVYCPSLFQPVKEDGKYSMMNVLVHT